MKPYFVRILEAEFRRYIWCVNARSEKEAGEKALEGKGDVVDSEFVEGIDHIDKVIEEVKEQ